MLATADGVGNVTQGQGFRIPKCYPSAVHSMFRGFTTCFRGSGPVQCAVGVSPTNALLRVLGSAVQWVVILPSCPAVGPPGGGGG